MILSQAMFGEEGIGRLFSAPQVVAQLLGACQDASITPRELREIVLQDSALCAKIMHAAVKTCPDSLDSARPISSAVAALTPPVIKSLALQSARSLVESRLDARQAQFLRELRFFSQAAGGIAHSLAEAISYPATEEAQVTAMLTNIGMLALFSKNPEKYLQHIDSSFSSEEVRVEEQACFAIDHLQLADALVSGWKIDSFMADAIRFSHLDGEKSRDSTTLVKIAQLTREICRSPLALHAGSVKLAEELFKLKETETSALFHHAESRYRAGYPFDGRQEECLRELIEASQRLTSIVFSLLDQDSIRLQLSEAAATASPVSSARQLYLHNSAALEAVFFIFEQQSCRLVGLPSGDQSRLVAGLATPLAAANLLAGALKGDRLRHSFEGGEAELTVFDQQLIRLCKGKGIACLPLWMEDRLVGGVALGLYSPGAVASLSTPNVLCLNQAVALTLATLTAGAAGPPPSGGDGELVPRLAHEISTPLAIINNYMSILGTFLEGSDHSGILSAVGSQIERIDEILKYHSAGPDTPKPSNTAVALDETIVSVVESLGPTHFAPKKIEVVIDFDPAIGAVSTNRVAIKQILVNLLTNSAEALAEHGRVVLRTREQITSSGLLYVVIGVEDNGPGIDKRILGSLFSPVISTKGANHAGLGLSIVKGMVDDIGATIMCHSTSTSGTTFSLMIPRAG